MKWTEFHGAVLCDALERILGSAPRGAVAFVRCLTSEVVEQLGRDMSVAPAGWQVQRVADRDDADARTIRSDRAVEMREEKVGPVLFLVDTERSGAGMDSIYSAAREVGEENLFEAAYRAAMDGIGDAAVRKYADQALRAAPRRNAPAPWARFDYLCRVAAGEDPGVAAYLLGLWPIRSSKGSEVKDDLKISQQFVDRLLAPAAARSSPAARIETLGLEDGQEEGRAELERFLNAWDAKPQREALAALAEKPELWVGALLAERGVAELRSIRLTSWRNRNGSIARWSGLVEPPDRSPELVLSREEGVRSANLEVRWKAAPDTLRKGAVNYWIEVLTDQDEPLASQSVPHRAMRGGEKCRFSADHFSSLEEDAYLPAKVKVTAGEVTCTPPESEDFVIRFGESGEGSETAGSKTVRAFSEGLIELANRNEIADAIPPAATVSHDAKKGLAVLRTSVIHGRRRSWRTVRAPLVAEAEEQWIGKKGKIGRWRVRVRDSGAWSGPPEFAPLAPGEDQAWKRAADASRQMAAYFARTGGGVAQVYDGDAAAVRLTRDYLTAWTALLADGIPEFALAHTVEVMALSGRTIGLVVLPAHPIRMAWLAAYDNLLLHARFEEEQEPERIREAFACLDGAMYPTFLPNPDGGAFVFADTLGFHAIAMAPDDHREPKATVAMLASAVGNGDPTGVRPTTDNQSAAVLCDEIVKYRACHQESRWLHLHGLRAGDGRTLAKALGKVTRGKVKSEALDDDEGNGNGAAGRSLHFSLEMYPSTEQRTIAGRFLAEAQQKRRSGAGVVEAKDRWMLESVPLAGGITLPRLRWARKESEEPEAAAHLAVAFDTFESRVSDQNLTRPPKRPHHAFGMLSFYERSYESRPSPRWTNAVPIGSSGEKHPSDRTGSHTTRLAALQRATHGAVGRHLGSSNGNLVLKTEISPERARDIEQLHKLCDWVITLDRNAGIEYFDSPRENPSIYDAYVIDCVPEREDLGCLQLITSTANLDEVRALLDSALDGMGLSRSRRNAEFLMKQLKALSGRLAIRLTGHKPATSELVALAMSHANCRRSSMGDECWTSLTDGFFIPVDDVLDLLPPLGGSETDKSGARADLIHVSAQTRGGLLFRFIEVKYRRHLLAARASEILARVRKQTEAMRKKWLDWYDGDSVCPSFRAVRRAKLARVLRFYADKGRRHYLDADHHKELVAEIDRMIEKGGGYAFGKSAKADRGWVFCPEYAGVEPTRISPGEWGTQVFLFGPANLPDSDSGDGERALAPQGSAEPSPESARGSATTEPGNHRRGLSLDGADSGNERETSPRIELGSDARTGEEVRWELTVKGNPHLLLAGLPGMGKTTCLSNLCRQMVEQGVRPIVFSYHSDIDEKMRASVPAVRFVDFDELGFNPLHVRDRTSRLAHLDVAGDLRDIFMAIFPELGDVQGERVRSAIRDSFREKGWGEGERDPAELEEPAFQRFFEILRDGPGRDQSAKRLLARLDELHDYGLFDVGSARGSLWDIPEPAVIRIHRTQNENLQRALASFTLYGLYKDMFRRGTQEGITHAVIFDEAHRAARLKLIPRMAKECRKYGVSLVLASQEAKDFDVSVFSAIANYLVLRLTDADARSLVRNVASSRDERLLMDQIKQMDRFRALYFCEERSKPYRVALSKP